MLDYVTSLHVGTIFEIFFVSALGFALPYYYIRLKKSEEFLKNEVMILTKSFSTGVIFGVGKSFGSFSDASPDNGF